MEIVVEKYKQTEVGLIPSDWEVKKVGEIFTFYSTANFSKAEMSLYGEIGCVHYGLIHAIENSNYSLSNGTKYYVTKEQAKYETLQEGDVIMVDASEDLVGLNKSVEVFDLNKKEYIAGLHTFHLRDINSVFVATFRGLILNSYSVKKQFLKLAVGMKVFGVSKPQLQNVLIPIPSIAEQTAIATVLNDMNDLINSQSKLVEKKKAIKQGAIQHLLKPKEGWVVKKLGDVVEIRKGQLITESTRVNGDIPVIAGGKSPAYYHNKSNRNGKTITISGSGASAGYVAFHNYPIFASDCSTIEEHKDYSIEYVFYLLQSLQEKIYKMQTGGAQPHIHPSDLNPIEVSFPKKEKQDEIARVITDMDNEIQSLEQNLSKYQMLKQGMMQELLTGKTRLI